MIITSIEVFANSFCTKSSCYLLSNPTPSCLCKKSVNSVGISLPKFEIFSTSNDVDLYILEMMICFIHQLGGKMWRLPKKNW